MRDALFSCMSHNNTYQGPQSVSLDLFAIPSPFVQTQQPKKKGEKGSVGEKGNAMLPLCLCHQEECTWYPTTRQCDICHAVYHMSRAKLGFPPKFAVKQTDLYWSILEVGAQRQLCKDPLQRTAPCTQSLSPKPARGFVGSVHGCTLISFGRIPRISANILVP